MDYRDAIDKVLIHEGGFVNHPADKGGATNFGITQKVYEEFKGRTVSLQEMKLMPKADAYAIYKAKYWDKIQGDKIRLFSMAFAIFDQAVNRGPSAAIKQAQKVLRTLETGKMDDVTISRLNTYNERDFLNAYLAASAAVYRSIASNNPSQSVFLQGWLNRVDSLKKFTDSVFGSVNSTASVGVVVLVGFFLIYYFYRPRRA